MRSVPRQGLSFVGKFEQFCHFIFSWGQSWQEPLVSLFRSGESTSITLDTHGGEDQPVKKLSLLAPVALSYEIKEFRCRHYQCSLSRCCPKRSCSYP